MRIAGLLLVAVSAAPAPGSAFRVDEALAAGVVAREGYAEAKAAAVKALLDDIGEYAGWCTGQKLFAERDRAWNVVLAFEPDHEGAHKALGHKRAKDGTWGPDPRRLPPKDRNAGKLREAPERWAKVVTPYRERILALAEAHAAELGAAGQAQVLAELLVLSPDDPELRKRNGQALLDGAWVLRETAAGKARRAELKTLVEEAYQAAPAPETIQPDALESVLGIAWTQTLGTPLVRVLATGDADEARRAAQAAYVAGALFQRTLGERADYPSPMRFFLLAHAEDKAAYLAGYPGLDAETRRFWENVLGAGVPGTGDFAYWADTPAKRVDGMMRILLGWLAQKVHGLTPEIGWIHEGFGIYQTMTILGTRLNWFALPGDNSTTAEHNALIAKLYDPAVNWMDEAVVMLNGERPPKLARFLKKDVQALTAQELLYSYVLAAYLIEGRPDETPELMRRIGGGMDQDVAIQQVLGLDLQALDERVLAWLSERR